MSVSNLFPIFAVLLGIYFNKVFSQRCPNRWLERPDGETCYRLFSAPLKTWDEARASCHARDGELLRLDSKEEKEWIISEIVKYPASYEWWIGLNNQADVNTWVWADGTPRNDTFILWGSGEPNNYRGEERCAEIWDSLLNDKNCRQPLQYICERKKDLPMKCDVDDGWDGLTADRCFKLFDKKHTFEEAKAACAAQDAGLLSNMDETLQTIITDFLQSDKEDSIWIGLKYLNAPPPGRSDWYWDNGDILTLNRHWKGGRPLEERVLNKSLNCVSLNTTEDRYGNWVPTECTESLGFICQKAQGSCPNGWLQHQSTCYQLATSRKLTWNEAVGHCNLQGARILEIRGKSEQLFVGSLIRNKKAGETNIDSVWIGLTGRKGQLQWNSHADFKDVDADVISDDSSATDNQDGCVYLQQGNTTWRQGDCGLMKDTICTVPVNTPVIQLPDILPKYECPFAWLQLDNVCYFIRSLTRSWEAARYDCQQMGADLVVINDQDTLDYIADLVNQEVWIGLNDRKSDDNYVWLDTEHRPIKPFWKKEEINGHVIGGRYLRNCVAMSDRKWITYPCSFKLGYVCGKRAELNIAPGKIATQSSTMGIYDAQRAIEGCASKGLADKCCTHTVYEVGAWWELDLGTTYEIGKVIIKRRFESNCEPCKTRMHNFRLFLSNISKTTDEQYVVFQDKRPKPPAEIVIPMITPITARYVRIDVPDRASYLTLCEVLVFQAKDIYSPVFSPSNPNCFTDSMTWNGTLSHTVTGRKCQEWAKDVPHKHRYHIDNRYPEGSEVEAKSFCRDPDGDGAPWCYTIDPDKRWEYCGIPSCTSKIDKPEETTNTETNCEPGWNESPHNGQCYRLGSSKLAWCDAVSSCEAYNGQLLVIQDENEFKTIKDIYSNYSTSVLSESIWMGIHDSTGGDGYRWQSIDSTIDASSLPLKNLNSPTKDSNCIALKINGGFSIMDCSKRLTYICKRYGKYMQYYTVYTDPPITLDDKNINMNIKQSIFQFTYKGSGSIGIQLHGKAGSEDRIYKIVINDRNSRSFIETNEKSKYTHFEKYILSSTEFRPFWILWIGGIIKVGKGDVVDNNIFLEWTDTSFTDVTSVTIYSGSNGNGYWRFPMKKEEVSKPTPPKATSPQKQVTDVSLVLKDSDTDLENLRSLIPLSVSDGRKTDSSNVVSFIALEGNINIAAGKPSQQSSLYGNDVINDASKAVDGCKDDNFGNGCCTHTKKDMHPWWQVDIERTALVKEITIYRRTDCGHCAKRMNGFRVFLTSDGLTESVEPAFISKQLDPGPVIKISFDIAKVGRYIKIDIPGRREFLTLCEVEVIEAEDTDVVGCGTDWNINHATGSCYKFLDERRTWEQARDRCAAEEGVLSPIISAEEQLFIFEKTRTFTSIGIWFDAHKSSKSETESNANVQIHYKDEPKFSSLWPGVRGDCYSILLDWDYGNGMWVDFDCSAAMAFVCNKQEMTTTTSTTVLTKTVTTTTVTAPENSACAEGWTLHQSSQQCYIVVQEHVDWYSAKDKCKSKHGKLASVTSAQFQDFFKSSLPLTVVTFGDWDGVWADGQDVDSEGLWKLSSGEVLPKGLQWAPGQPDDYLDNEDCLSILTSYGRAGLLNDGQCHDKKGYICQTDPLKFEESCEQGWLHDKAGGYCYKRSKEKLTWHASEAQCKRDGAELASISSRREQEFLKVLLVGTSDYGVWVGAHDIHSESQWIWSNGKPWFNEIQWAKGQPDNWRGVEDCGMLRTLVDRGALNDLECLDSLEYICMKKAVLVIQSEFNSTIQSTVQSSSTGLSLSTSNSIQSSSMPIEPTAAMTTLTTSSLTKITGIYMPLSETCLTLRCITAKASVKCGSNWEERPHSEYCYQFNMDLNDLAGALAKCEEQQSSLVSIVTPQEQAFISGRVSFYPALKGNFWIGLRAGMPSWMDMSPLIYFNWAAGQPDFDLTGAAVISQAQTSFLQWKIIQEKEKNGYICKRNSLQDTNATTPVVTESTTIAGTEVFGCPGIGWLDYKSSCYMIIQRSIDWKGALQYCRNKGADLASINTEDENDFVYSQLPKDYCANMWNNASQCNSWAEIGECSRNPAWMAKQCQLACKYCHHNCRDKYDTEKCMEWAVIGECEANPDWMIPNCAQSCGVCYGTPTRGMWIGLTKSIHSQVYSWTDLTKVSISHWGKQQPTHFASPKTSCVAMFLQTGMWNDGFCSDELPGFVCEAPKRIMPTTTISPFNVGCPEANSLGYEGLCYTFTKDHASWSDAEDMCKRQNGHLAAITDRFIQSFVSSELVGRHKDHWIGLQVANSQFSWSDGQGFIYTHFGKHSGSSQQDFQGPVCYTMSYSKPVGLWNPYQCNETLPFICQTPREGYTTATLTTLTSPVSTTPIPCIFPWKRFGDFCYLVSEEDKPESWFVGEEKCLKYGGNIASIHSLEESQFIISLFDDYIEDAFTIWIGFNDLEIENTFVWTDSSSVSYEAWAYEEPNNVDGEEHCGELVLETGLWNDNLCYAAKPYVCKLPRGFKVPMTSISPSPTTENPCPEGWLFYSGYCYFNSKDYVLNWHDARFFCKLNRGELVSVHSKEENNFIISHMSKNEESAWLGLNDLDLSGFEWSDGTSADFFQWSDGEPNDFNGNEKCTNMIASNGRWNDLDCSHELSFMCKRPSGSTIPQATSTTITIEGGCNEAFILFGSRCYFISTQDKDLFWAEAKDECEKLGPGITLASIHTQLEQAFITTLLKNKSASYWIGLNDLSGNGVFQWTDSSPVQYTYWDKYAPKSSQYNRYPCVALMNVDQRTGFWMNFQCSMKAQFICSASKSASLPTPSPLPALNNTGCASGFQAYGDFCYMIVSQKQTWKQAREYCTSQESELVSITDYYEQAYVEVLIAVETESIWIGLYFNDDMSISWIDGSKSSLDLKMMNDAARCGTIQGHVWPLKDCSLMLRSVCKKQKDLENSTFKTSSLSTATPQSYRYVCNKNYTTYKGHCYYVVGNKKKDFNRAQEFCRNLNMSLISIHDKEENAFVQSILGDVVRNEVERTAWIGLKRVQWKAAEIDHSYYLWTDETPVTFLDNVKHDGSAGDLNLQYGYIEYQHHWKLGGSSKNLAYICKGVPDIREEITTPTTTTESPTVSTTVTRPSKLTFLPFSNRVTPRLPPFHQAVRSSYPVSENSGLTGGQVAGIIIGILGFVFIILVITYVIWKNWKPTLIYKMDTSLGFDNALFHRTNETVSLSE